MRGCGGARRPYQLWLIVLTEYLEPYEGLVRLPQAVQKHNTVVPGYKHGPWLPGFCMLVSVYAYKLYKHKSGVGYACKEVFGVTAFLGLENGAIGIPAP